MCHAWVKENNVHKILVAKLEKKGGLQILSYRPKEDKALKWSS
jgi:Cys-tRNA synthase (O-phospho-L-seryl-tRNA:Cys-tRNA synthase)